MAYKALYREYRPTTWDEVVGQKYIVKTLKNAIKNDRIAHAYLFTGPRGTGKTTIARLLAASLNCTNEDKPCGVCEHCRAIEEGTYPDVIEIDAASNNGVEEARDLIDKVKYTPMEGKYKVYIIDEVHMMTGAAFNTLLKTLEEPPAHAIFILATTEVQEVLPTIISRCQRFDFSKISEDDLADKIKYILNKENITYENGVINLITSLAEGGCRNAESILDQAIAYAGNHITCQDVRDIYGVLSIDEIIKFIKLLAEHKVVDSLNSLKEFDSKGIDIVRLTSSLIDVLKDVVVYNKTLKSDCLKVLKDTQALDLSFKLNSETIFEYIDILMDANMSYKRVDSIRSYFELTILKICDVRSNDDLINKQVIENKEVENELLNKYESINEGTNAVDYKEEEAKKEEQDINEFKEFLRVVEDNVPESNDIEKEENDVFDETPISQEETNNIEEGHFFDGTIDVQEQEKEEVVEQQDPVIEETYIPENLVEQEDSKEVEQQEGHFFDDVDNNVEEVITEQREEVVEYEPNDNPYNVIENEQVNVNEEETTNEMNEVEEEQSVVETTHEEESIFSHVVEEPKEEVVEQQHVELVQEQPVVEQEERIVELNNIVVTDQIVLNFLVNCEREYKMTVGNMWNTVRRYLNYPKYKRAATMLLDCSVLTAGKNCVLFGVDTDTQVRDINGFDTYYECKELIRDILGSDHYYLAIKSEDLTKYIQVYRNARNMNMLPEQNHLRDFYSKEDVELYKRQHAKKDENLERGKAIFGNDIKIEG